MHHLQESQKHKFRFKPCFIEKFAEEYIKRSHPSPVNDTVKPLSHFASPLVTFHQSRNLGISRPPPRGLVGARLGSDLLERGCKGHWQLLKTLLLDVSPAVNVKRYYDILRISKLSGHQVVTATDGEDTMNRVLNLYCRRGELPR
eukprot:3971749-Amphidinium_carterae.1